MINTKPNKKLAMLSLLIFSAFCLSACGQADVQAQALNSCSKFINTIGLEIKNPHVMCSCIIDENEKLLDSPEEFNVMLTIMADSKTVAANTEVLDNAHAEGRISKPAVSLNVAMMLCLD